MTLQKDTRITLNQFVGQEGLQISKALSTSCVNFASDASSYTIPQAIPKMKARRVFVVLGANDVDGSVSVDSFIADYKQFLQSIRSAYAYCDIIAVGIPPVTEDSTNAAETQTRIDQFNQAIAAASSDLGFKYLNTAEALKNTRGYGEGTYFESNGFSTSGRTRPAGVRQEPRLQYDGQPSRHVGHPAACVGLRRQQHAGADLDADEVHGQL